MDIRPAFDSVLGAFGLPATVTFSDGTSVETTAAWLSSPTEDVPHGTDLRRAEQRKLLSLGKADVPALPRGTVVTVAETEDADAVDWLVDSMERMEYDHFRFFVTRAQQ